MPALKQLIRLCPCSAVPAARGGLLLLAMAGSVASVASVASIASAASAETPQTHKETGKAAPRPKRRAPGLKGMVDAAQEHYDAGRWNEALKAYGALLKRYPAYEPAGIQVAKVLYRQERLADAFQAFGRVPLAHLDSDTSYEYGFAFYNNRSYEGALAAFARVPKGHALYDLASYYGGISAIKLHHYDEALELLDRAIVLPDKLAKSRSLYVKHVQALQLMQQRSTLAKERDKERDALAAEAKTRRDKRRPEELPKPPSDAPYEHKGFKSISRTAEGKYTVERQSADRYGYSKAVYEAKVADFDLTTGPLLPLPIKVGKENGRDRQGAAGLKLALGAEDAIRTGREQRLLVEQSSEDLTRQFNQDLGTTETKLGKLAADAWVELPAPGGFWGTVGGEAEYYFPNLSRSDRTGFRRGYLDVNHRALPVATKTEASYKEIVAPSNRATIKVTGALVEVGADWPERFAVRGKLAYDHYSYLAEGRDFVARVGTSDFGATNGPFGNMFDGPDSVTTAEVKGIQYLPFGAKVELLGAWQNEPNYIFNAMPTYGQIAADGQVFTGKVTFALTPTALPIATISLSEMVSRSNWKLHNPDTRTVFEVNQSNYLEDFVAWASIKLLF